MPVSKKILVVDDETLIQAWLGEALSQLDFDVTLAENGDEAFQKLNSQAFDLVISDVRLPDINGMEILQRATELEQAPGVIMMTAYGDIKDAVTAIREGAYDYITKPFNFDEIEVVLNKYFKFRELQTENKLLKRELSKAGGLEKMIGRSKPMLHLFEQIKQASTVDSTVLITGESGTGKELVARAIHKLSDRCSGNFVAQNCAAFPKDLMESELFGHEKGAFTGAAFRKEGKFMRANRGTLFLDEISEMALHLQAKLLRVVQEKEIEPIGGSKIVPVDVRVLVATNRDLFEQVKGGNFREDLFYRLNVFPIHLPPLRERKDDIPFLVDHFVDHLATQTKRTITKIEPEIYKIFESYNWPGNVRELSNELERAIIISREETLTADRFTHLLKKNDVDDSIFLDMSRMTMAEIEKKAIVETLRRLNGNRSKAADSLGISVRTLRNKLKEYKETAGFEEVFEGII